MFEHATDIIRSHSRVIKRFAQTSSKQCLCLKLQVKFNLKRKLLEILASIGNFVCVSCFWDKKYNIMMMIQIPNVVLCERKKTSALTFFVFEMLEPVNAYCGNSTKANYRRIVPPYYIILVGSYLVF